MLIIDGKRVDPSKEFLANFTKPVTFELHVSQTPTSHITGKRSFPRSRGIEPFYHMVQKEGGNEKIVTFRYAETQRVINKGGLTEYIHTPNEIEFLSKGNIVCDPTVLAHRELYYWLHLNPHNASGPNYDPKKGAIFYEINPEKEAKVRTDAALMKHENESLILKTWNLEKLREIALEFGDTNANEKEEVMLRDYLMQIMTRNPVDFHKRATSDRMNRRAEITEAIGFGIIRFNEKDKVWAWGKNEAQEGAQICVCANGEDSKERLLRFFDSAPHADNLDWFTERLKEERGKKTEKPKQTIEV